MATTNHGEWARSRVSKVLSQGPSERVVAVLVGSVDLVAAIDGRSIGLTSEADRALVRAWREAADVLLVGTRTLEAELYSGSIVSADGRRRRASEGKPPLPPILTIDRSGTLELDLALRGEAPPPVSVYVPPKAARDDGRVTWIELARLEISDVLSDARDRFDARLVVAEGGPRLLRSAFDEGVVTDLSLTVAPLLVGDGPRLFGAREEPPHSELLPAEVIDGYVFAHWIMSPTAGAHANGAR